MTGEPKYENYLECLQRELAERYRFSLDEADGIVRRSFVMKMLQNEEDADYQMHEGISITIADIYNEYRSI